MRSIRRWSVLGAASAALLVPLLAGAADSDEPCPECREARTICLRAAHAAHRVCRDGCADAVEAAVDRARLICREEGLDREACGEVIHHAVAAAFDACRNHCREAREHARERCRQERLECREACGPPVDLTCATGCYDDFGMCREDLEACASDCRERVHAAVADCREALSETDDHAAFRDCVGEARRLGHECAEDCHAEIPCGPELRVCLGECTLEP